ncbi:MAG: hypothetical protein J6V90_08350 [Treponema sp.]|nr:hypothetical protein [Treponema sp.]
MKEMTIRAVARKFDAGYLFVPATKADKQVMQMFCEESKGEYVTMDVTTSRKNKSYDQVKTVWALIELIYEVSQKVRPTTQQAASLYMELIMLYADRVPSLINIGEKIPVTLSQMDKEQAVRFIQCLINHLCEMGKLSDLQASSLTEIFQSFEEMKGGLDSDPVDKDSDGNWLTVAEWKKRNNHSFASGRVGDLEVAHIVTRGSSPQNIESVWNLILLTHEEHIEIQHGKGWDVFLGIYPHLKARVNRARRMAEKEEFQDNGKKSAFETKPEVVSLVEQAFGGEAVKESDWAEKEPVSDIF